MTLMVFQICAVGQLDDGRIPVHAYISHLEPTRTDNPGCERRALKDAERVIGDIFRCNIKDDDSRLLRVGDPPHNAMPLFAFAIGVSWNREAELPHYSRAGYRRIVNFAKFASVFGVGMEIMDTTMEVLRKREKEDFAKKGAAKAKNDELTRKASEETFNAWADSLISEWIKKSMSHDANEKRFGCERYRNGYCTPVKPDCLCFKSGRCEECRTEDVAITKTANGETER